jgi:hypothetical protein
VIEGYAARCSVARPSADQCTVFIEVTLSSQGHAALDAFERAVAACAQVLECHLDERRLRLPAARGRRPTWPTTSACTASSWPPCPHVARVRTAFAMRAVVPSRGYPL